MLLEAETNKYCPGGNDFGAISNLITWVLNFFLSVGGSRSVEISLTLGMQQQSNMQAIVGTPATTLTPAKAEIQAAAELIEYEAHLQERRIK
jgi:hypothetical protein